MNESAAILALVIFCPLSALLAFLVARPVLGFEVRYLKVLLSTVAGFAVGIAAQVGLAIFPENVGLDMVGAVLGWGLMGLCHRGLLIGPKGERVTFLRAMALVAIQLGGVAMIGFVVICLLRLRA